MIKVTVTTECLFEDEEKFREFIAMDAARVCGFTNELEESYNTGAPQRATGSGPDSAMSATTFVAVEVT